MHRQPKAPISGFGGAKANFYSLTADAFQPLHPAAIYSPFLWHFFAHKCLWSLSQSVVHSYWPAALSDRLSACAPNISPLNPLASGFDAHHRYTSSI